MSDETEDDSEDLSLENYTKWVILVDVIKGGWIISRVPPNTEVGEYEMDMCNNGQEYRIGAHFDPETEKFIEAMIEIGGDSQEVKDRIADMLHGTIRSFLESQANLKKWQAEKPKS